MMHYSIPCEIEHALAEVAAHVGGALSTGDEIQTIFDSLDSVQSAYDFAVCCADYEGCVLATNQRFRTVYAAGRNVIGKRFEEFLDSKVAETTRLTNRLVTNGCQRLLFNHIVQSEQLGRLKCCTMKLQTPVFGRQAPPSVLGISCVASGENPWDREEDLVATAMRCAKLTDDEVKVVRLICDGNANKQIAGALSVSARTVENRRKSIMDKLGVQTSARLVKLMVRAEDAGLIQLGI